MSCLFKDPVVVMKEIMFLLIMDPTVTGPDSILTTPNETVKNY